MNEIKSVQKKFKLRVILAVIALILSQGSIWGGMILDIAPLSAIGLITSSGYVMAIPLIIDKCRKDYNNLYTATTGLLAAYNNGVKNYNGVVGLGNKISK